MPTTVTISGTLSPFRQGVNIRTPEQYFNHIQTHKLFSAHPFRVVTSGTTYNATLFDDSVAGRGPERLGSMPVVNVVIHDMEVANFGQSNHFKDGTPFKEMDDFVSGSATGFLGSIEKLSRYPIVLTNKTITSLGQLDGVIEPLTIRREIEFSAPEGIDVFHKPRASLQGPYAETSRGNYPILQQVAFTPQRIEPFFDSQEIFGSSSLGFISLPGFVMDEKSYISPFNDESIQHFRVRGLNDGDIKNSVMEMTGSTQSMFINNYRSTTAGFRYVNINKLGTDSVAFGGLKK